MKPRSFGAATTIAVAALLLGLRGVEQTPAYRDIGIDAAKWIRTTRAQTPFGLAWPTDPNNPRTLSTALYNGSPGVVLFLFELHHATGEDAYLEEARKGANDLLTKVPTVTHVYIARRSQSSRRRSPENQNSLRPLRAPRDVRP
jgi:hypothetical protein